MSSNLIRVGSPVFVPGQTVSGELRVTRDHGNEVTLSNGQRIYKAKCTLNWRQRIKDRK